MTTAKSEDTADLRKARGSFFTPEPISRFIARCAIRAAEDRVLEPSASGAEFMLAAVRRLSYLSVGGPFPSWRESRSMKLQRPSVGIALADVEDRARPCETREDPAELCDLHRRNRLLERENEVLCRGVAYLSPTNLQGKSSARS